MAIVWAAADNESFVFSDSLLLHDWSTTGWLESEDADWECDCAWCDMLLAGQVSGAIEARDGILSMELHVVHWLSLLYWGSWDHIPMMEELPASMTGVIRFKSKWKSRVLGSRCIGALIKTRIIIVITSSFRHFVCDDTCVERCNTRLFLWAFIFWAKRTGNDSLVRSDGIAQREARPVRMWISIQMSNDNI